MLPENQFHSATSSELDEAQARRSRFDNWILERKNKAGIRLSAEYTQDEAAQITAAAKCLELPIEKFINDAAIHYAKLVLRHR
tara:strand:- start:1407 stop:1655 length:249 start_codon:yes stop_codon:yes gene_type:complete